MDDNKIVSYLLPIISTLLSMSLALFLASLTLDSLESFLFIVSVALFASVGVILICFGIRKKMSSCLWRRKYKKRLKGKKIGILVEKGCPPRATGFPPSYWEGIINDDYSVQRISYDKITDDFVAIINPYGEVYREDDYTNFGTFNRIKKYVKKGGIFVSAGGLAFWWAWDKKYNRLIPTAKEIYGYQARVSNFQQSSLINLVPNVMIGTHSLVETLTNANFKLLTTINKPQQYSAYQTPEDKKFCGNIESIGGTKDIVEFRGAREPLPKCYPMLRATTTNGSTIYPILAIPHGRGIFVFGGVSLDFNKLPCNKTIAESQVKKIVKGLDNIIKNKIVLKIERGEV